LVSVIIFTAKGSNSFTVSSGHRSTVMSRSMSTSSNDNTSNSSSPPTFPDCLPKERLGTRHGILEDFHLAVGTSARPPKNSKEYTLIVVTETSSSSSQQQKRILLGMKNRGFGTGKYNSFGGKFLHDDKDNDGEIKETIEECACRELEEETNLKISLEEMDRSKVGIQRFTFDDNDKEMIVHLFYIDLANNCDSKSYEIKACDEITPRWFENFDSIPFDNMFADDSLWLTALLSAASAIVVQSSSTSPINPPLEINGSYHFKENCEETNTIMHYHMDVRYPEQN